MRLSEQLSSVARGAVFQEVETYRNSRSFNQWKRLVSFIHMCVTSFIFGFPIHAPETDLALARSLVMQGYVKMSNKLYHASDLCVVRRCQKIHYNAGQKCQINVVYLKSFGMHCPLFLDPL